MEGMSNYYSPAYSPAGPQGSMNQYGQDRSLSAGCSVEDLSASTGMGGAQTLDQIINHNNQELMRRRTNQPQSRQESYADAHHRRASMLEFGSNLNSDLAEFQFDPGPAHATFSNQMAPNVPPAKVLGPQKVPSQENISLDTQFSRMSTNFAPLPGMSSFSPAIMTNPSISTNHSTAYLSQTMDMSLDYENQNEDVALMSSQNLPFSQAVYSESPVAQNFTSTTIPRTQWRFNASYTASNRCGTTRTTC